MWSRSAAPANVGDAIFRREQPQTESHPDTAPSALLPGLNEVHMHLRLSATPRCSYDSSRLTDDAPCSWRPQADPAPHASRVSGHAESRRRSPCLLTRCSFHQLCDVGWRPDPERREGDLGDRGFQVPPEMGTYPEIRCRQTGRPDAAGSRHGSPGAERANERAVADGETGSPRSGAVPVASAASGLQLGPSADVSSTPKPPLSPSCWRNRCYCPLFSSLCPS